MEYCLIWNFTLIVCAVCIYVHRYAPKIMKGIVDRRFLILRMTSYEKTIIHISAMMLCSIDAIASTINYILNAKTTSDTEVFKGKRTTKDTY